MRNTSTFRPLVQSQDLEVTNQEVTNLHEAAEAAKDENNLNPEDAKTSDVQENYQTSNESVASGDAELPEGSEKESQKESEETPEDLPEEVDPKTGAKKSAGKAQEKSQEDSSDKDGATMAEVEPVQKEQTVSKSIRLWQSAFDALRVLMGIYGMNMVDMVSTSILAYAVKAAAAPIVRFRIMGEKSLFPLQASATDIRTGLSSLRNDLYKARKSHSDPEERKALYLELSFKYQKLFVEVEKTLTLMNKECLLHDLLEPGDHQLLVQAVLQLKASKPITRAQIQIRDLYLKIFETLLIP